MTINYGDEIIETIELTPDDWGPLYRLPKDDPPPVIAKWHEAINRIKARIGELETAPMMQIELIGDDGKPWLNDKDGLHSEVLKVEIVAALDNKRNDIIFLAKAIRHQNYLKTSGLWNELGCGIKYIEASHALTLKIRRIELKIKTMENDNPGNVGSNPALLQEILRGKCR